MQVLLTSSPNKCGTSSSKDEDGAVSTEGDCVRSGAEGRTFFFPLGLDAFKSSFPGRHRKGWGGNQPPALVL